MRSRKSLPVALTVAGSDSGGGAGIQADLKTFAALGTHGATVITCLTAQNPGEVLAIEPCSAKIVREQLAAVSVLRPAAAKTGMLFNAAIIREVASYFSELKPFPLVVDPVMMSTSGARLIDERAVKVFQRELFPLAAVVTPNVQEAEALTGLQLTEPEDLRKAARAIHEKFGCAALVKGGHLATEDIALDLFWDGKAELLLEAPRARNVATHGTGCTYAAAITAFLARGHSLPEAVAGAKDYITRAIHGTVNIGEFQALQYFNRGNK
jgi:hydroxymethylpyrimidine/phosphomethylpyrimidine kinase